MTADLDPRHELPQHPEFLELPKPSELSALQIIAFGLIIFGLVVGVGYWWMNRKTAQPSQSPGISQSLSTSSPSPINENKWKKYSNEALGYSFEYPPQYSISEENYPKVDYDFENYFHVLGLSQVGDLPPKQYFGVNVFSNINKWSLDKWLEVHNRGTDGLLENEPQEYYLDGRKGLSNTDEECGNGNVCYMRYIYVANDTLVYSLHMTTVDPITDQERDLFDQILSTFQFVD